jgi:hypothetical protein
MRRSTGSIWQNVANRGFQPTWPNAHHPPRVAEGTDKVQSPAPDLRIRASQVGKVDVSRRVPAEWTLLRLPNSLGLLLDLVTNFLVYAIPR